MGAAVMHPPQEEGKVPDVDLPFLLEVDQELGAGGRGAVEMVPEPVVLGVHQAQEGFQQSAALEVPAGERLHREESAVKGAIPQAPGLIECLRSGSLE